MTAIVLYLSLAGIVWGVISIGRVQKVYAYRISVLDEISDVSQHEIENFVFDRWRQRYEAFDSVSFNKMVLEWWKPLDSYGLREKCGVA